MEFYGEFLLDPQLNFVFNLKIQGFPNFEYVVFINVENSVNFLVFTLFPHQKSPLYDKMWKRYFYISRFSARRAFCSINIRLGSTLSPIRSENISSQAIASSTVTLRIVLLEGSIVVSQS